MNSAQSPVQQDPRVYFAAERTFLAWIRTGLALMGFGFVVARFGLFLRELAMRQPGAPVLLTQPHSGASLWLGTALVGLGVVVQIAAAMQHYRQVRALHAGQWTPGRPSKAALAVSLALALAGIGLGVYLVLVR